MMPQTRQGIRHKKPWWVIETPHYIILFDSASRKALNQDRFARQAETRLTLIAKLLDVKRDKVAGTYSIGHKMTYFVHRPGDCPWGNVAFGGIDVPCDQGGRFYQHEEAHLVLASTVGCPSALFCEGFAMFAQEPKSQSNHRIALAALEGAALPEIGAVVDTVGFWKNWKRFSRFMYYQAGSFIAYLFARFGRRRFRAFCRDHFYMASRSTVARAFVDAYNLSPEKVAQQWRAYLYRRRNRLKLTSRFVTGRITERRWVQEGMQRFNEGSKK